MTFINWIRNTRFTHLRLFPTKMLLVAVMSTAPASAQTLEILENILPQNDRNLPAQQEGNTEAANDDAALERQLANIFANVDALSGVEVQVDSGVVQLRGTVLTTKAIERAETIVSTMNGVVTIENDIALDDSIERRIAPAVARFQERVDEWVSALPLIGVGLIIVLIFLAFGLAISRAGGFIERASPNIFIGNILRQLVRLVFVLAGLLVALDVIGASALIGSILGLAGIASLAVGFAVRDTIENYVASILLSVRQPFLPNDHVKIDGQEGTVARLTSRATILISFDGNHIRIPNATVFKTVITNFSRSPERRFDFEVGVGVDTDLTAARALALDTLANIDGVLPEPAPWAFVEKLGDFNIVLRIAGWVDQGQHSFLGVRSAAIREVKARFDAEDIEMPEPTYTLKRKSKPAPKPGPAISKKPNTRIKGEQYERGSEEKAAQEAKEERAEPDAQNLLAQNSDNLE